MKNAVEGHSRSSEIAWCNSTSYINNPISGLLYNISDLSTSLTCTGFRDTVTFTNVGAPTSREFPRFVIISLISPPEVGSRWWRSRNSWPFWEKDRLRANFHKCFPKWFTISQIHVLCANFVKFDWPEIGKVVRYLRHKKIRLALPLSLLRGSRSKSVRPAPDNHHHHHHHLSFIKKLTNATIIQFLKRKLRCVKELRMDDKIALVRSSVSSCVCRLLEWYSHC